MKYLSAITFIACLMATMFLLQCREPKQDRTPPAEPYLLLNTDTAGNSSYQNLQGEVVIAPGKYSMCLTDTFKNYAIVLKDQQFVVIDRQEKVAYEVFNFDNGPDYPSDGLFRIVQQGKIGYADAATYQVVIAPQYECAYAFDNGSARVSLHCKTEKDGEYSTWISEKWERIDKKGQKISQ